MLSSVKDYCPYCGEVIELVVDPTFSEQTYTEDCFVCCRPINVSVFISEQACNVSLFREDD